MPKPLGQRRAQAAAPVNTVIIGTLTTHSARATAGCLLATMQKASSIGGVS